MINQITSGWFTLNYDNFLRHGCSQLIVYFSSFSFSFTRWLLVLKQNLKTWVKHHHYHQPILYDRTPIMRTITHLFTLLKRIDKLFTLQLKMNFQSQIPDNRGKFSLETENTYSWVWWSLSNRHMWLCFQYFSLYHKTEGVTRNKSFDSFVFLNLLWQTTNIIANELINEIYKMKIIQWFILLN